MTKTTQVFRRTVEAPISTTPGCTAGALELRGVTTVTTWNVNDLLLMVGPLDPNVFHPGDRVKVIVQKMEPKRAAQEKGGEL